MDIFFIVPELLSLWHNRFADKKMFYFSIIFLHRLIPIQRLDSASIEHKRYDSVQIEKQISL